MVKHKPKKKTQRSLEAPYNLTSCKSLAVVRKAATSRKFRAGCFQQAKTKEENYQTRSNEVKMTRNFATPSLGYGEGIPKISFPKPQSSLAMNLDFSFSY